MRPRTSCTDCAIGQRTVTAQLVGIRWCTRRNVEPLVLWRRRCSGDARGPAPCGLGARGQCDHACIASPVHAVWAPHDVMVRQSGIPIHATVKGGRELALMDIADRQELGRPIGVDHFTGIWICVASKAPTPERFLASAQHRRYPPSRPHPV